MARTAEVDPGLPAWLAARLRKELGAELGLTVREMELPAVEFAYDPHRQQYASLSVLEWLSRRVPADAMKMLAITDRDLFLPVLTFVYGQAQLNGTVAVVSLARLRQEFYGLHANADLLGERAWKEALHETGHLFGLVHCADRSCAMALSTGVRQIDSKNGALCEACAGQLGSLKESIS